MKIIFVFLSTVLLIFGCSSTPIISNEVIHIDSTFVVPPVIDTLDITPNKDSTEYYGIIHNSQGDSIGFVIAKPAESQAIIFVQPDSLQIKIVYIDKDTCKEKTPDTKDSVFSLLNWWEESIVFLIVGLLLLWKTKRKVPLI